MMSKKGALAVKNWIKNCRLRNGLISGAYWLTLLTVLELLLHILAYGAPTGDFWMVLGFNVCIAGVTATLFSFLPEKPRLIGEILVTALVILFFASQTVYFLIFGTLYSVALVQQGGQALTNFWKETMLVIRENLPWVLGVLATGLLLWPFHKLRGSEKTGWSCRGILLAVAVVAQLLSLGAVKAEGTGYFSDYYFYHSNTATTDQVAQRFGLLTAFRLNLFGTEETDGTGDYYVPTETAAPQETLPEETAPPETEPVPPKYNILDFDFDALNAMTDNEKIQSINDY